MKEGEGLVAVSSLRFFSQKDLVEAIKEAKDAFATQAVTLGHMTQTETEFIAAYLFEHQGTPVVLETPDGSSRDNMPEELQKAVNVLEKYQDELQSMAEFGVMA